MSASVVSASVCRRHTVRFLALATLVVAIVLAFFRPSGPFPGERAGSVSGGAYWLATDSGKILNFGGAAAFDPVPSTSIVGVAATPSGNGLWLVGRDGGVFSRGDAGYFGSLGAIKLNRPIVGMAATRSGQGYWLVGSDGGMFAFGDAGFYGSLGAISLNKPIVGMAATPSGRGYWLVASDGGMFAFGDAKFFGSMGGIPLNKPVVGMAAGPDGDGYWLVASDGGTFSFGNAAFHGSTGNIKLASPIVSMATTPASDGYWMLAQDGGVFAFDAPFLGAGTSRTSAAAGSPSGDRYVGMAVANARPKANDDAATVAEDGAVSVTVLANDEFLTDTPLTVQVFGGPAHGTAVVKSDLTVSYTPAANFAGTDSFRYRVKDKDNDQDTASVTITVTPVNDPPKISNLADRTINEDGTTGPISFTVSDVDDPDGSLAVSATSSNGQLVPAGGLTFGGSGSNRTLTVTPAANANGTSTITVKVSDGKANDTDTFTLTVNPVNDAPVASPLSISGNEDAVASGAITASDVDGDTLSYAVSAVPAQGTASVAADGTVSYTPNLNANGSDSFTVTVSDGHGGSAPVAVSVTTTPVNDAPVAAGQSVSTDEDTAASASVSAADVDSGSLTYSSVAGPAHGGLVFNSDGSFTYTPDADFDGSDSFTFKASDGALDSNVATVSITVNAVNDAPVAAGQSVSTDEDTAASASVSAADVDSGSLTYSSVAGPAHGGLVFNSDGSFTYTPDADFNGSDSFTFKASDGALDSNVATVSITVNAVNDASTVTDITDQTIAEDEDTGALAFTIGDVETPAGSLTVTASSSNTALVPDAPANLALAGSDGNRTLTVTPVADGHGAAIITVTVSDGQDSISDTFNLTVTPVNDTPMAFPDSAGTNEDTPVNIDVLANDTGLGDTPITVEISAGTLDANSEGTATVGADNTITFTPAQDVNGTINFSYRITDLDGETTLGGVTVTVAPVNDAPVAQDGSLTLVEDVPAAGVQSASDVDGDVLDYALGAAPTKGTATVDNVTGAVTYDPNQDENGSDSFTVTVSDGHGGTGTATWTVTIAAVNDAPAAGDQSFSVNEDTVWTGSVGAVDVDGDSLAYSVTVPALAGAASVDPVSGALTYTPDPDYNGPDRFTVTVDDGHGGIDTATFTVTVDPVNDAPVAQDGSVVAVEDGGAVPGAVVASDVDDVALTYAVTAQGSKGAVDFPDPSLPAFTYTPNANANGSDSFTVTVSDGHGGTGTATWTVTIAAVNDAPAAGDQSFSVNEDTVWTGSVGAVDVDGDSLAYSVTVPALAGAASVDPVSGALTYTPDPDYNGPDRFTVTVDDGHGGIDTATFTVTVDPVNDAPVAQDGSVVAVEDGGAVPGAVVASDVDDVALTYAVTAQGSKGAVDFPDPSLPAFTYTPNANANGSDSFTVTVSDGHGGTGTATWTVTIAAVNDAPAAGDQSFSVNEDTVWTGSVGAVDVDGDSLAYSVTVPALAGAASVDPVSGALTYTPDPDYNGPDRFTVTVDDGHGGIDTATFTVTVDPVNDDPVATGGTLTLDEDALVPAAGVTNATDAENNVLNFALGVLPTKGTATVDHLTGAVTYDPDLDENGTDSFTVVVTDGFGGSDTATWNVTINPVNDSPIAVADVTTSNGSAVVIDVKANDTDVDDGDISSATVSLVGSAPTKGAVNCSTGGSCTYTPSPSLLPGIYVDTFTYRLTDPGGLFSDATVTIAITKL